jgi:hypothetical protein
MVCEQRHHLLADYVERMQALAIEAELLVDALEESRDGDWAEGWQRVEQARINCDIARLALSAHISVHGC